MAAQLRLVSAVRPKRVKPARAAQQRLPNSEYRTREHLLGDEFDLLFKEAKSNRHGHRDSTMLLVMVRHGFRVSELIDLRWDQIDFRAANMHVRRLKNGTPSTQPIRGDELRALRKLHREQNPKSAFVFTSERGGPFTRFAVNRMIERLRDKCQLEIKAHPHMLRHTTGFILANKGHDTRAIQGYFGHKNIQHTTKYTELAEDRFKEFFR